MNSSATLFSTTQTGRAMQRMPAQPKVELMMPAAARSREASGQHQAVVLGFGLSLDAFTVGGGHGVDVPADIGGADETDAPDQRVGQQQFGFFAAAGDHVDDALGQTGLKQQLKQGGSRRSAPCSRP